jgi:hypothetical protein
MQLLRAEDPAVERTKADPTTVELEPFPEGVERDQVGVPARQLASTIECGESNGAIVLVFHAASMSGLALQVEPPDFRV